MKNNVLKVFFLTIILSGIIISCQKEDEEMLDDSAIDILQARMWYESTYPSELTLKSQDFSNGMLKAKPDWNFAFVSQHKDSKTVEVPLTVQDDYGFATEESYQTAKETGDKRFIVSRTTMVIETKGNKAFGFLMTIIPDKDYQVANDFEAYYSTYKKWQKGFSGFVVYHNLDGSFSNGWKLSEGNVITSLKHTGGKETSTELLSKSCWYYFFVLHYTICGPGISNTTKGTNGCIYYEEWNYMYTLCDDDGGGGGGGGGGYTPPEDQQQQITQIYSSSSTLSPTQKEKLEVAIANFKNLYPAFETLWTKLIANGIKIKFIMKSDIPWNGLAAYYPGNIIAFKSDEYIDVGPLAEELIHAYQSFYYSSEFNASIRNFEYETKVFQDLACLRANGACPFIGAIGLPDEYASSYIDWILNTALDSDINISMFNYFCSHWTYGNPNNYVDPNFVPEVLIEYFFNSSSDINNDGTNDSW